MRDYLQQLARQSKGVAVDASFDYGPSEFLLNEHTFLIPRRPTVPEAVKELVAAKRPFLSLLSHTLSMNTSIASYLRERNHTGFRFAADRLALLVEAVRQFNITGVLALARDAKALDEALQQASLSDRIRVWHVLEPIHEISDFSPAQGEVRRELQLFPGFSIFFQCPALDGNNYHACPDILVEAKDAALIVSAPSAVVPFAHAEVARGSLSNKECSCGKPVFSLA
jgi:hypothetical protein